MMISDEASTGVDGELVASRYAGRPVRFPDSPLGASARRSAAQLGEMDRKLLEASRELTEMGQRLRAVAVFNPGVSPTRLDPTVETERLVAVIRLLGSRDVQLAVVLLVLEMLDGDTPKNLPYDVDTGTYPV